jgi:hypothetical protein
VEGLREAALRHEAMNGGALEPYEAFKLFHPYKALSLCGGLHWNGNLRKDRAPKSKNAGEPG